MIGSLSEWLYGSYLNTLFSDTSHLATWLIIPVSQTLHIIAVSVVMISVGVLNLRLLGVAGTRQSFAQLAAELIPWIWAALALLLLTGAIQTIAEPDRELLNTGFRIKMVLLAVVIGITAFCHRAAAKHHDYWDFTPTRKTVGRLLATFSLLLWVGIASLGRLIAYWT